MKCVICKNGETRPGHATVTLERDTTTLVVKGVPARVCGNCGEEYVDEATSAQILDTAQAAARAGVQVEVREYVAAQVPRGEPFEAKMKRLTAPLRRQTKEAAKLDAAIAANLKELGIGG